MYLDALTGLPSGTVPAQPVLAALGELLGTLTGDVDDAQRPAAPLRQVLERVAALVPTATAVSVTERRGAGYRTTVSTAEVATAFDEFQYRCEQGPCIEAAATAAPVWTADLEGEARWPVLVSALHGRSDIRSVISHPLLRTGPEEQAASVNFYGTAFAPEHAEALTARARLAAALLTAAVEADEVRADAANLRTALASSRRIGAAVGVLMARRHVVYEQAFELLRSASQMSQRKLRDIAEDVLLTGDLPTR